MLPKSWLFGQEEKSKGHQGRPVNKAFDPLPDEARAWLRCVGIPGEEERTDDWDPRREQRRLEERDSPITIEDPPTKPPSDRPVPSETSPQASAVSDSNTRQRQNTQVHEDTKTPRGGHAKTMTMRAEGGAPEWAPPPRKGVTPPIKMNRNPPKFAEAARTQGIFDWPTNNKGMDVR